MSWAANEPENTKSAVITASKILLATGGFMNMPNARGKRRSTEGAQGTNKGHENAEGMAFVRVRLTAQLGDSYARLLQRRHECSKDGETLGNQHAITL